MYVFQFNKEKDYRRCQRILLSKYLIRLRFLDRITFKIIRTKNSILQCIENNNLPEERWNTFLSLRRLISDPHLLTSISKYFLFFSFLFFFFFFSLGTPLFALKARTISFFLFLLSSSRVKWMRKEKQTEKTREPPRGPNPQLALLARGVSI